LELAPHLALLSSVTIEAQVELRNGRHSNEPTEQMLEHMQKGHSHAAPSTQAVEPLSPTQRLSRWDAKTD
jgi:hypothetical protein